MMSDIDKPIKEYLEHLKSMRLSLQTIDSAKKRLKKLFSFLKDTGFERVCDISLKDLERYRLYLVESKLSGNTILNYLHALPKFFKYLENKQVIFANPAKDFRMPKISSKILHVPSQEDMKKLLLQPDITTPCGIRDRAIIETMYSTGIRLNEISGIEIFDVDLKQGLLKVLGKGNKERMAPLGKQSVFWLDKYIREVRPEFIRNKTDEHGLFIGNQKSLKMSAQMIDKAILVHCRKAGLKNVSPHAIRRACATHMLNEGAHPVQIQTLLGHSSMSCLSKYLKITVKDMLKTYKKGKPAK